MGSRMDKYKNVDDTVVPKRSEKNKVLYRQIYNAYDEFENLVVPSNAKEIDIASLKKEITSRDEYKQMKDYTDITNNKIVKTTTFKPDSTLTPKQQEKVVQKFAMEFEDKVKNGYSFDGNKMSFEEFADKFSLLTPSCTSDEISLCLTVF